MILGSLLDCGVSLDDLNGALKKLNVNGYSLASERAQRGGLDGTHLRVNLDDSGSRTRSIQDFIGIVEGSEPDQELRETRLKLRALLAPLTEI